MSARALVVGAGPAGLAAALGLAGWCESVTVLEARPRGRLRQAGEHLSPAGLAALCAHGLEALVTDRRHGESPGVRSAWGDGNAVDRDYFFSLPNRGLNLRRRVFDQALAGHAERHGARLLFDTRLRRLERVATGYLATVSCPGGERRLEADVVVDASGRGAVAARRLGATRRRFDRLVGVTGLVQSVPPGDDPGRLHIEAAEDGWWYGVRMPDGTLFATYMTDARTVRDHPEGARGLWRDRLGASTLVGPMVLAGRWSGGLQVFDAATQALEPVGADGFLAVGDAAAAFDPLSSWGIAKAVDDGHAGAGALERARRGAAGALAEHRRRQRASFARYRVKHRELYAMEARWPASPFWTTRQPAFEHVIG